MARETYIIQGHDLVDRGVDEYENIIPQKSVGRIAITLEPNADGIWATSVTKIDEEEI